MHVFSSVNSFSFHKFKLLVLSFGEKKKRLKSVELNINFCCIVQEWHNIHWLFSIVKRKCRPTLFPIVSHSISYYSYPGMHICVWMCVHYVHMTICYSSNWNSSISVVLLLRCSVRMTCATSGATESCTTLSLRGEPVGMGKLLLTITCKDSTNEHSLLKANALTFLYDYNELEPA